MRSIKSTMFAILLSLGVVLPLPARPADPPPALEVAARLLKAHPGAHCASPHLSPQGEFVDFALDTPTEGAPKTGSASTRRRRRSLDVDRASQPRQIRLIAFEPGDDPGGHEDIRLEPRLTSSDLAQRYRERRGQRDGRSRRACDSVAWAPDGKALVLECTASGRGFDIYFATTRGRMIPMTTDGANDILPSITTLPEGRYAVAFVSGRSGRGDVYLATHDPAGGVPTTVRQATHDDRSGDFTPRWSPDGRHLAFARSGATAGVDLFVLSLDTLGRPGPPRRLVGGPDNQFEPSWSPDGTRVAYLARVPGDAERTLHLHVIGADATGMKRLASGLVEAEGAPPAWLPDGSGLLIARRIDTRHQLEIVRLDGSRLIIETGTTLPRQPSIAASAQGDWRLVWVAQGRRTDPEQRWQQLFSAVVRPPAVRPEGAMP